MATIDDVPSDSDAAVDSLTCAGIAAEPAAIVTVRNRFKIWLSHNFDVDDERAGAVTLAVNEALANAVEHAYVERDRPGTVDVTADHESASDVVVVKVADRGRWREPVPDPLHLRGRGIPLIEALADEAVIDKSDTGTTVTMSWNSVARRRPT